MKNFARFSLIFILLFSARNVFSQEFNSADYKVLDPVMQSAGYSASDSFQLWGTVSQIAIGTSTSDSFSLGGGFLYYPYASTPAVSATAGDAQVALSWTASEGFLGWTASGYKVGQSASSGGPYSYSSSLGNVTSSTRTGLSNGTAYYFIVVAEDAYGNNIATSTEVSATPASSGGGGSSGGGSSGGGSSSGISSWTTGGVDFEGRAFPLSKVGILKDGQQAVVTIAGPDSKFSASLHGLSAGNYNFAVYGEDNNKIRSKLFTFPVFITAGVTTKISGIFIAPIIAVDKSEVKKGEDIAIFGRSVSESEVTINVNSEEEFFIKKTADKNGVYLIYFDTSVLDFGQHSAKSKASKGEEVSSFSEIVGFKVGTETILAQIGGCPKKGDLNNDCKVNLVDFSIAAFWYKKPLSDSFRKKELEFLNSDGKIDLVDFSIMAYYWTG